jgi:YaiO family outer membrane protein
MYSFKLNFKKLRIFLSFVTLLFLYQLSFAQIDTLKLGVDDLFALAKERAFSGQREQARVICKIILLKSPNYSDVRILMGRTLAWDGRRDEAREEFKKVLEQKPDYKDAINALIDVEVWDDKSERALVVTNQGLQYYPTDENFLVKKAKALIYLGRDEEALIILSKVEEIYPANKEVSKLRNQIRQKNVRPRIYTFGVTYTFDRFSAYYSDMHYSYIQLGRPTQYGSIIGRLNYSNRFNSQGVQSEIDFYPKIRSGMYGYLNYAYSNSSLFPAHRFGLEFFSSLPYSLEGSIGLRHLIFSSSSVTIYTASLGYYYGSYWLSIRTYITPNKVTSFSRSLSFTTRRYFGDAEDYIYLRMGAGFSPDERRFLKKNELFYLRSQSIGLGWQQVFYNYYLLIVNLDFVNQEPEFKPGTYVKDYSFSIGFRMKL